MKIAYLAESPIPSGQANAFQVMQMCEAFAELGHEVTLYARQGELATRDLHGFYGVRASFRIVHCARPGFSRRVGRLMYGRRLAAAAARDGLPDCFYGRESYGLSAASRFGRPVVLESHSVPGGMMRWTQRRLFGRPTFARLVVKNRTLGEDYLATFPALRREQVVVAHNAVRSEEAEDAASGDDRCWTERTGALQVGYLGQLYPGKGMEVVVPLAEACPEVDVHVVGGAGDLLDQWREKTRHLANLHFHGQVPPAATRSFRSQVDVLLMPTQPWVGRAGGGGRHARWVSPLKLFEYMAAGRAVVASNLPAVAEVVEDGVHGLLVPPDHAEAWIAAVRRLAGDRALREDLGRRARAEVLARHTWRQRAEQVLEGVGE